MLAVSANVTPIVVYEAEGKVLCLFVLCGGPKTVRPIIRDCWNRMEFFYRPIGGGDFFQFIPINNLV